MLQLDLQDIERGFESQRLLVEIRHQPLFPQLARQMGNDQTGAARQQTGEQDDHAIGHVTPRRNRHGSKTLFRTQTPSATTQSERSGS